MEGEKPETTNLPSVKNWGLSGNQAAGVDFREGGRLEA